MTRIVTTSYRPKRPPRKRKAVALNVPAITPKKGRAGNDNRAETVLLPTDGRNWRPSEITAHSYGANRSQAEQICSGNFPAIRWIARTGRPFMSSEPASYSENLRGQVALITGGSRGIGRALAMGLAKSGAAVAVVARTQQHVAETVADIAGTNGRAIGVVADVTDRPAVERMVREVEDKVGPVDLLINNAAVVAPLGPIAEVDPEAWWRTQEINVRGPMLCTRMVLPGMLARRGGRIVNMISDAGMRPIVNMSAYLMSKVALIRFTELLALETSELGIHAFAVNPGAVRTGMTEHLMDSAEGRKWTPWAVQADAVGTPRIRSELDSVNVVSTVLAIAAGRADVFSGRLVNARVPLEQLLARAQEIERDRLYILRLEALPGLVAPVKAPPPGSLKAA